MQGSDDLDALLSAGEPGSTPVPASEPRETDREPVETGEKQDATAPPAEGRSVAEPEAESWTKQAVLDERRKRQELEKRLKEYEQRLQPQAQQPAQPQQPQADWWSSPDQAAQVLQQQVEQQVFQTRVAMSERMLRQQHPDYDEVSELFAERARQDPNLLQQVFSHPFPAEFAYQVGQQIKMLQEIGNDPSAYRQRLRDQLREEILAEMGQQPARAQTPQSKPAAAVPRSLARDVSQQPRQPNGRFGNLDSIAPLDDLLG